MAIRCGIVGLPNVGKSTIFNALTASAVPAENYPFCTIEPHLGVVSLPDSRLAVLEKIFNPAKITPGMVEFTDIAGLVRGASAGEGLGNRFLGQIRQAAVIIHVVRCFEDENVTHVEGGVDPVRDAELIETELLLADIESLEKQVRRLEKMAKKDDSLQAELDLIIKIQKHCDSGKMARSYNCSEEELPLLRKMFLLTRKPILYVANVNEAEITSAQRSPFVQALFDFAEKEHNQAIRLCGKLEAEIALLDDQGKSFFLEEFNLPEPGLNKLIRTGFKLLNLETFFTGGPTEVRAWTIKQGSKANEAAGEIHTDFKRGFIKAEIWKYDDLKRLGSEKAVKEAGLVSLEGKDYVVQDGDCIYFHFNV